MASSKPFLDLFVNQLRLTLDNNYTETIDKDKNQLYASVAIIIRVNPSCNSFNDNKSPYQLLVIRRSVQPTDKWPGDTALPGGRNPRKETLKTTAERETMEEIGLDLTNKSNFKYIGYLPEHISVLANKGNKVRGIRIYAFIYFQCILNTNLKLKLNKKEIECFKWIDLAQFGIKPITRREYSQYKAKLNEMKPYHGIHNAQHVAWSDPDFQRQLKLIYAVSPHCDLTMSFWSGYLYFGNQTYPSFIVDNNGKDFMLLWGITYKLITDALNRLCIVKHYLRFTVKEDNKWFVTMVGDKPKSFHVQYLGLKDEYMNDGVVLYVDDSIKSKL